MNQTTDFLSNLPDECYGVLLEDDSLILIRKGEPGYYNLDQELPNREMKQKNWTMHQVADEFNTTLLEVTPAQRKAMEWGSQFGWHTPLANPAKYDKTGKILPFKKSIMSELNKLSELDQRYLVADLDTEDLAMEELRSIAKWNDPVVELDEAIKELKTRRARYRKDYSALTVQLKGEWETRRVWLYELEIFPEESLKYRNHSPDGFNWGYGGSGPAQLALALCLELFGPDLAPSVYQTFKFKHIASLPQGDFETDLMVNINELK